MYTAHNIIASKAMAHNMTAADWFLPKKTALGWYGYIKSEKYGPKYDYWGVSCSINHCLEEYDPKYDCFKNYSLTYD
jgi:hypothetical protein